MTSFSSPHASISAAQLADWLQDGEEIALIDVREYGQYGEGHPFFATHLPYSQLELLAPSRLPRPDCRIVLFDQDDGVALQAAHRLASLGYSNLTLLEGGAASWLQTGHALFQGVNLPSKTFGEWIEQIEQTPHLSAAELHRKQRHGEPFVLVDGRTPAEHRKMTIPGAIPIPNGELPLRIHSVLPDAQTPVIVHCAGRTRSIIGAQTLLNLGLPNPVFALENGTQGWALAGLPLEHGSTRPIPPAAAEPQCQQLTDTADQLAHQAGVVFLDPAQARDWALDTRRTTYFIDIRSAEEIATLPIAGLLHVPGGQLVQCADQTIAVRHSRVVLIATNSPADARTRVVATWLRQLGIQSAILEAAPDTIAALLSQRPQVPAGIRAEIRTLDAESYLRRIQLPTHLLLDLRSGLAHRSGHPQGARWSIRPHLPRTLATLSAIPQHVTVLADSLDIASLAAFDLNGYGIQDIAWAAESIWHPITQNLEVTPDLPSDEEMIDYLFFVHDRHDGNLEAARCYLAWETNLLAQCQPDELSGFRGRH
ncbi:rhodanese-like domain-containing protein [Corticimicrobacter populi]|uniref:Sulfurtransferase n=1 Tax=Corticimicrobacter populi TaxID=2175229 RepID=A0A2V1JUZ4_9BURK|nr:rhodanese-like domain-containing protein [Corticimicrobacter populi]PWF21791.1 sulfurtransferase [Corticimicrobacter populi]